MKVSERIKFLLHGSKDKPRGGRVYTVILFVAVLSFLLSTAFTSYNPIDILSQPQNFIDFVTQDFWPVDMGTMLENLDTIAMTIEMAIGAAFVSALLAFVTAVFGSKYTTPWQPLTKITRGFASFLRNIPSLVWAFILFMSLGVGTGVGFVALSIATYSFLVRSFIETIDEVSNDAIEALTASGASFWQVVFGAVVPSCMQGFMSWFLYCIEVNIRDSTIIGMVGGGGIGMVLLTYIKSFHYHQAGGIIFGIAAMVIIVDLLTNYLRKKVETA
jgi:phosphonate transport system permease protein